MKKSFATIFAVLALALMFTACNTTKISDNTLNTLDKTPNASDETPSESTTTSSSNVLIAYFSCTNTTKDIAERIEAKTGGMLYQITPEVPYTEADLAYYTNCRADREQSAPSARPAISGSVDDMSKYDVVFLGYPIWHSQAPKIIYTFLENYDFSGKTIIPFCTSGSSPIGSSATNLHSLANGATWLEGRRFPSGASQIAVDEWVDSLDITLSPNGKNTNANEEENAVYTEIYLTIGNHKIAVNLEKNAAALALVELLKKGDITYTATDYGNFEKVGGLGHALPTSDELTTTSSGDVMLYLGNQIVLFYGSNSWSYTRLGKMQGLNASEIRAILAEDDQISVTISLQ